MASNTHVAHRVLRQAEQNEKGGGRSVRSANASPCSTHGRQRELKHPSLRQYMSGRASSGFSTISSSKRALINSASSSSFTPSAVTPSSSHISEPEMQLTHRLIGRTHSLPRLQPRNHLLSHRPQKMRVHPGQVAALLVRTRVKQRVHVGSFSPPTGRALALALFFDFFPMTTIDVPCLDD
eukprot:CAMPEP_0178534480 /NCGR_PEP_ID=MMETSP0696-20121128/35052_1 /TAXON_ID=265572 /ORGANISM="Extubocellulus spinifer, Strain CCMP396" /LENGTH=180 /DNA_ID=CAMNT_0020166591 /DNA_START=535 /DNA_END=1074 /DNA_ORIENTATION=+